MSSGSVVLNHVLGRVHRSPVRTFGEVLLLAGLTATATFFIVFDGDVSPDLRSPLLALGGVGLGLSVVGGAISFASPVTMRGGASTRSGARRTSDCRVAPRLQVLILPRTR